MHNSTSSKTNRLRTAVALFVGALSLFGCSALLGISDLPSDESADRGNGDGSNVDGNNSDGSTNGDAATSDGATPDAPSDATEDHFCNGQSGAFYCQDFDTVTVLNQAGNPYIAGDAAAVSVRLDTSDPSSPPRSLYATTDGTDAIQEAAMSHDFGSTLDVPNSVTIDADMKCVAFASTTQSVGFALVFQNGTELHQVAMTLTDNQIGIAEGNAPADGGPLLADTPSLGNFECTYSNAYRHLEMTVTQGTPYTASFSVDGINVFPTVSLTPTFKFLAADAVIQLGVLYNSGGTQMTANLDNVVIRKD
jgi:hypothetical protein